jgi:hypothetical protein
MPFAPKAAPLSFADGPRLDRAINALSVEQRALFVELFKLHLATRHIQSLQRKGQFLYINVESETGDAESIFDFGGQPAAQLGLTALTDCLRSQGVPVKVLMPAAPPKAS